MCLVDSVSGMTTTNSGGHRLRADADRKHTKPIPAHLLGWFTAFDLTVEDRDDSVAIWQGPPTPDGPVVGSVWGHAAEDTDIWFAIDWRNPKEAVRVTGGRDGALRHILDGHEIRLAAKAAKLTPDQTHLIAKHEYDEAIFGGFFCNGDCMTPAMRDGITGLVQWPCTPLVEAGMTRDKAVAYIEGMRAAYALGRWPASAAQSAAHR